MSTHPLWELLEVSLLICDPPRGARALEAFPVPDYVQWRVIDVVMLQSLSGIFVLVMFCLQAFAGTDGHYVPSLIWPACGIPELP